MVITKLKLQITWQGIKLQGLKEERLSPCSVFTTTIQMQGSGGKSISFVKIMHEQL